MTLAKKTGLFSSFLSSKKKPLEERIDKLEEEPKPKQEKKKVNYILTLFYLGGIYLCVRGLIKYIPKGIEAFEQTPSATITVNNVSSSSLTEMAGQMGLIGTTIGFTIILLILITFLFRAGISYKGNEEDDDEDEDEKDRRRYRTSTISWQREGDSIDTNEEEDD